MGVCSTPLFKDIKQQIEHLNLSGNVCKYLLAVSGLSSKDAADVVCLYKCVCSVFVSEKPQWSSVFELRWQLTHRHAPVCVCVHKGSTLKAVRVCLLNEAFNNLTGKGDFADSTINKKCKKSHNSHPINLFLSRPLLYFIFF